MPCESVKAQMVSHNLIQHQTLGHNTRAMGSRLKVMFFILFMVFSNQILANVWMDEETLRTDEVATLIYVLGCGDWESFSFTVVGNQITANADVPTRFINCSIDPAPPQFWNRIPLTQLSQGDYILNLTLTSPDLSRTYQIDFTVNQGATTVQPVPALGHLGLMILGLLIIFLGLINFKSASRFNT